MASMNIIEKVIVNNLNRLRVPPTVLRLLDKGNIYPTGAILEIGAGLGYTSHAIFKRYHPSRMFICDFDATQVERGKKFARKKFGSMPLEFVYQREDVLDLSFADKNFDMVIATLMFHHVENNRLDFKNTPRGIGEIQRVLKPGGIFFYWDIINQDKVERLMQEAGYETILATQKQRVFRKY